MALHVPRAPGFASMMKDGSKFFSGLEEAVIRNIGACKEFAETVQTCYGPNGMNKMVINHLEKLFVTNDGNKASCNNFNCLFALILFSDPGVGCYRSL